MCRELGLCFTGVYGAHAASSLHCAAIVLIDSPPASNQNDKRSMVRGCLECCPVSTIRTVLMESALRVQKRKPGKSCRVLCDT